MLTFFHMDRTKTHAPAGGRSPWAGLLGQHPTGGIGGTVTIIASKLLLALSLLVAMFTIVLVLREHVRLPGYDEWASVAEFRALSAGQFRFVDLFSQHNEHRLVFPRLVFFADFLFFRGLGYCNVVAVLLTQGAHAVLLIAIQRAATRGSVSKALMAALTVLCLFSLGQSGNFIWGFQVQFVGVFAAATLAVWSYVRALPDRPATPVAYRALAPPLSAIVLATFTMANGILTGLICVVIAVIAATRWTIVGMTAAFTATLALIYFTGFVPGDQQASFGSSLSHPLLILRYMASYLGNISGSNVRLSGFLGGWGLVTALVSFGVVARERGRDRPRLILFGITAFIAATALATAWGRSAYGVSQATESRYNTPTFIFWIADIGFWCSFVDARRRSAWLTGLVIATAIIVAGCAVKGQINGIREVRQQALLTRQAGDSLLAGTFDPSAFRYDNEEPATIRDLAGFLRVRRLSIFSDPGVPLLGQTVDREGRIGPPDGCSGTIDLGVAAPTLDPDVIRVAGTAKQGQTGRGIDQIYLADVDRKIIGYASGNQPASAAPKWLGYAVVQPPGVIQAYARLDQDVLCRLGSITVPTTPEPTAPEP